MKNKSIYSFMLLLLVLVSCDEQISPDLVPALPVYVVDAFINTKDEMQVIHLTKSQSYFEETLPPGVSGAIVTITDGATVYAFAEDPGEAGRYQWIPDGSLTVGKTYTLSVLVNGESFAATSKLGRVPVIDSITFAPSTFPGETNKENFFRAQFWATDPAGEGDTYWIRASKNGELLNKPSELNLAYDAAFSKGSGFDGFTFIQPIRNGINPDNSEDDDNDVSPYSPGDSVYVEIHSLSEASFNYLNEIAVQTNRPGGFGELFARPLANVSTNVKNETANGTAVVGFFNMASVAAAGKKFIP